MSKAVLLKTNGVIERVKPKNGSDFQLEELRGFVGGNIEIVRTKDDRCLVVNDEGLIKGLPFNALATDFYLYGDQSDVVGNVLMCDRELIK